MGDSWKRRMLLGLTAGVVAGVWVWRRHTEQAWHAMGPTLAPEVPGPVDTGDPVAGVARALDHDLELAPYGLGVHGLSDGVIEITGAVDAPEQRARVVAMAHNIAGIHTVVNRVRLGNDASDE